MVDDDLDLELDLDAEPEPRATPAPARKPQNAPAAGAEAKTVASPPAAEAPAAVPVVPTRKPGVFARVTKPVNDLFARLRLPRWNVKNFLIGLVVLVVVVAIADNWPPMRVNFIGLHVDVPKAVVLVVDFVVGFGVAWLILRRRGSAPPAANEAA